MEKYTAKQIVTRAMQLADIDNSSFISYKEHTNYLSLAWKKVCQSLINKGAKYYYKTVDVPGDGEYTLPDDFYQADSVRDKNGYIFMKKSKSQPDNSSYYDIVGNTLIVRGSSFSNVQLTYWTVPITLTFPAAIQDITPSSDILDADKISCCNNKIVYYKDSTVSYYNISTGETNNIVALTGVTSITAGKGAVFIKDASHTYLYDYNGNVLITRSTDFYPLMDKNNNIWMAYYTEGHTYINIVDYNNNVKETIKITATPTLEGVFVYDGTYFWALTSAGLTDLISGTVLNASVTSFDSAYLTDFDSYSAVVYNGNISYIDSNGTPVTITSDIENPLIKGLFKADNTTGYGYLTSDGTDYFIESYIPDTLLNFPNTLLFDYLAYQLAYYYVLKQSAETASIEAALSDAELAFFDSLDNGSTYGRIVNVYGGRF